MRLFLNKKNLVLALIFTASALALLPFSQLSAEPTEGIKAALDHLRSTVLQRIKKENISLRDRVWVTVTDVEKILPAETVNAIIGKLDTISLGIPSAGGNISKVDQNIFSYAGTSIEETMHLLYLFALNQTTLIPSPGDRQNIRTRIIEIAAQMFQNPRLSNAGVGLLRSLSAIERNPESERTLLARKLEGVSKQRKTYNKLVKTAVDILRKSAKSSDAGKRGSSADIDRSVTTLLLAVPFATEIPEDSGEVFATLVTNKAINAQRSIALAWKIFENENLLNTRGGPFWSLMNSDLIPDHTRLLMITHGLKRYWIGRDHDVLLFGLDRIIARTVLSRENIMIMPTNAEEGQRREKSALRLLETAKPALDASLMHELQLHRQEETSPAVFGTSKRLIQAILSTDSIALAENLLEFLRKGLVTDADLESIRHRFDGVLGLERNVSTDNYAFLKIRRLDPREQATLSSIIDFNSSPPQIAQPSAADAAEPFLSKILNGFWALLPQNKFGPLFMQTPLDKEVAYNSDRILRILLYSLDPDVREAAHRALSEAAVEFFSSDAFSQRQGHPKYSPEWKKAATFLRHSPALCHALAGYYGDTVTTSPEEGTDTSATQSLLRIAILEQLRKAVGSMQGALLFGYNDRDKSRIALPYLLVSFLEPPPPNNPAEGGGTYAVPRKMILERIVALLDSEDAEVRTNINGALEPLYKKAEAIFQPFMDRGFNAQELDAQNLMIETLTRIPTLGSVKILTAILKQLPERNDVENWKKLFMYSNIFLAIETFLRAMERAGAMDDNTWRFITEELKPVLAEGAFSVALEQSLREGKGDRAFRYLPPMVEENLVQLHTQLARVERGFSMNPTPPTAETAAAAMSDLIPTSPAVRSFRDVPAQTTATIITEEGWWGRAIRGVRKFAEKTTGREGRARGR